MHTPYDEVCTEVGDFVYIDPPYDTGFASYTSDGFSWDAQERLAQWAKGLGKGRCVVISNFATSRIVKLYEKYGFTISPITTTHTISANGVRPSVQEIIAVLKT